jgi:hypothetical protein
VVRSNAVGAIVRGDSVREFAELKTSWLWVATTNRRTAQPAAYHGRCAERRCSLSPTWVVRRDRKKKAALPRASCLFRESPGRYSNHKAASVLRGRRKRPTCAGPRFCVFAEGTLRGPR